MASTRPTWESTGDDYTWVSTGAGSASSVSNRHVWIVAAISISAAVLTGLVMLVNATGGADEVSLPIRPATDSDEVAADEPNPEQESTTTESGEPEDEPRPETTQTQATPRIVVPAIPADYTSCGYRAAFEAVVYVNDVTSCPFATNVGKAWAGHEGTAVLEGVQSPVTGERYAMRCAQQSPVVCRGGLGAVVLLDDGGESSAPMLVPENYRSCGEMAENSVAFVNEVTSCAFARNVVRAWHQGGRAREIYAVSSPVTGLDYDLACKGAHPTECTGGDDASVLILTDRS